MAVFVFVATTQGLVQVQSIMAEDPDIDSVVCLDGSAQQLPISRAYHQFVKKGTGLIEKDFACGAFRIDVDKPIDSGNSWQLGFYLAHFAQHKAMLGIGEPQAGDTVIWATGEVKIDKSLAAVAGVKQKCQLSAKQLINWRQQGVELLCVLPIDNQDDVQSVDGVAFLPCQSLSEVIAALDSKLVIKDVKPPVTNNPNSKKPWIILTAILSVSIVAAGAMVMSRLDKPKDVTEQTNSAAMTTQIDRSNVDPKPNDEVQAPYLRAFLKNNGGCQQPKLQALKASDFRFTTIRLDRLCQLHLMLPQINSDVLGIAVDTGGVIPVDKLASGVWDIAVPSSKYHNRNYLLLLFDDGFYNQGRNPLLSKIRRWRWDDKALSARLIENWIAEHHWPVVIYRHQLQDD